MSKHHKIRKYNGCFKQNMNENQEIKHKKINLTVAKKNTHKTYNEL